MLTEQIKPQIVFFISWKITLVALSYISFGMIELLSQWFDESAILNLKKICRIDDLFAKAVCRKWVIHLGEKRSILARILCAALPIYCRTLCFNFLKIHLHLVTLKMDDMPEIFLTQYLACSHMHSVQLSNRRCYMCNV